MLPDHIRLYREKSPEVKAGRWRSVIQDNGQLHAAVADSSGAFLLSEVGAGAQPLVAVGRPWQLLEYFVTTQAVVRNKTGALPHIYMGVDNYNPGKRFEGKFPIGDALRDLTKRGLGGFIPGTDVTRIGVVIGKIVQANKEEVDRVRKKTKLKHPGVYYLKLSYLPEDGMEYIATNEISFLDIGAAAYNTFLSKGFITED